MPVHAVTCGSARQLHSIMTLALAYERRKNICPARCSRQHVHQAAAGVQGPLQPPGQERSWHQGPDETSPVMHSSSEYCVAASEAHYASCHIWYTKCLLKLLYCLVTAASPQAGRLQGCICWLWFGDVAAACTDQLL